MIYIHYQIFEQMFITRMVHRMKIAMLVDRYKPYVSGITNYVSLNKSALEKAGHEVYVFTFGDEDYTDTETNIIRSPGIPLVDTGYYISLAYPRDVRHLLYTMDVAHVHHPFLSGSLALRYCRPRNIPILFTNHTRYDLYAQAYLPNLPESVSETAMRAFLPTFCRACDLVVAPSAGMADVLNHFGVDSPVKVIPNGVDLTRFQASVTPVDRSQFGLSAKDVILMYVGRLGPEKNLPFLLRSFSGTAHAFENIHLMVVGSGVERENLQTLVSELNIVGRVHFTGMIPYPELPAYLAMADAFVTASVTEVHPLSVIEAMAAGLPVLGVISPGVADTIEDGVTGFLAPEDMAAFTAKMVRLVTIGEERKAMGQRARLASAAYDIAATNKSMLAEYSALADKALPTRRSLRAQFRRLFDNLFDPR